MYVGFVSQLSQGSSADQVMSAPGGFWYCGSGESITTHGAQLGSSAAGSRSASSAGMASAGQQSVVPGTVGEEHRCLVVAHRYRDVSGGRFVAAGVDRFDVHGGGADVERIGIFDRVVGVGDPVDNLRETLPRCSCPSRCNRA